MKKNDSSTLWIGAYEQSYDDRPVILGIRRGLPLFGSVIAYDFVHCSGRALVWQMCWHTIGPNH